MILQTAPIRPDKVADAKRKSEAGTYEDPAILSVAVGDLIADAERQIAGAHAACEAVERENREAAHVLPPIGKPSLADAMRLGIADQMAADVMYALAVAGKVPVAVWVGEMACADLDAGEPEHLPPDPHPVRNADNYDDMIEHDSNGQG